MLKKADILPSSEEGWVVRFNNGYRLKIKGQTYCAVHRVISNCTPLSIWDMMRQCLPLEPVMMELPEEFRTDIKIMRKLLQDQENDLMHEIIHAFNATNSLSDKELGLRMVEFRKLYGSAANFIFACRKNEFLLNYDKAGKLRDSLYSCFRPTNNVLRGFVPSSSMSRFVEVV